MAMSRRWMLISTVVGTVLVHSAVLSEPPGYCAKDMDVNAIPPLNESIQASFGGEVSLADIELLQVHAIIRHGARGPYTKPRCWEGYDLTWDCNVTEVVSASLSAGDGGVGKTGLFRKLYDAYPSDNSLGGTCMEGQLLDEGYEQEQANGRHLRNAYLCDEPSCLAAADATAKDLQDSGALYLRSDDEQRTVMSGQILTASMLDVSGAVLEWHTGDDAYDYLEPNEKTCPRLTELSEEAFSDPSWTGQIDSSTWKALNHSMASVWGEEVVWWDVLDCLMTTACTGRELPEELTDDVFEAAIDFSTRRYVHESMFNDAAYGKLAMARFTFEIRERMAGAMNGTSPLKFILLSGHDTTFIPFMAAVAPTAWDQKWPRYAALATIELLRVNAGGGGDGGEDAAGSNGEGSGSDGDDADTDDLGSGGEDGVISGGGGDGVAEGYYFRFVYNGTVLKLEGCDQEICGIDHFFNATQFSMDIREETDHCCCRNMSQAAVDDYENSQDKGGSDGTPVPAQLGDDDDAAAEGAVLRSDSSSDESGLAAGVTTGRDDGDGSGSDAKTGGAAGIAFACFVIGAIVGGAPALMYFRRFRYEQMRGGGHSYEMT